MILLYCYCLRLIGQETNIQKSNLKEQRTWPGREDTQSFMPRVVWCCLLMETQGHARILHKPFFHPKAAFWVADFRKKSPPVSVECASKCFSKRTWSLTSRSFLSMKFPSFFQGRKKRILGKKGVLGAGSLICYPRRVTSNLLNFTSEFAFVDTKYCITKGILSKEFHQCLSLVWYSKGFSPTYAK